MKIFSFRLHGIRCFEDTNHINLGSRCNIFVGQNNSGKSTLLNAINSWQISTHFGHRDFRPGSLEIGQEIVISDVEPRDNINNRPIDSGTMRFVRTFQGAYNSSPYASQFFNSDQIIFPTNWPSNFIQPFIAKRKSIIFDQSVSRGAQQKLDGTFSNLYARIDEVASPGRSAHERYRSAIENILGFLIVTRSSDNGKEAGYNYDDDNFVTLDRMGDGISEIVSLVVDLSLSKNRVFVLEEPETNLHPKGLKALLDLIRESASENQFIIATHSNVVLRELAADPETKVFRVHREGDSPSSPSRVEEVERTPKAHRDLLLDLGYEFGDFDLHEAWLFLEESSAETVIREVLIPYFEPALAGRLRTFSAAGVTNLGASIAEFQRLIAFIHLEPAYQGRLWVRADGDPPGIETIDKIRSKFPHLAAPFASVFTYPQFEQFYPARFAEKVQAALGVSDKTSRAKAKDSLRAEVVRWSLENAVDARTEWALSAEEPIALLSEIRKATRATRRAAKRGS